MWSKFCSKYKTTTFQDVRHVEQPVAAATIQGIGEGWGRDDNRLVNPCCPFAELNI